MDAREGRGRESFGSRMRLILGNCLEKLKEIADCSVDSVVTDPPYGLAFMSKKWDLEIATQITCQRRNTSGGRTTVKGAPGSPQSALTDPWRTGQRTDQTAETTPGEV